MTTDDLKQLKSLCGKRIQLCLTLDGISGFVVGTLSQNHCTGGDYVIDTDYCRVVFNELTLDHMNYHATAVGNPCLPLVFIGKQQERPHENA